MKRKKQLTIIFKHLAALFLCTLVIVPFIIIVINSFKSSKEAALMTLQLPSQLIWQNYAIVIEKGKLVQSFFNSLLYAIVPCICVVIFCGMASFTLSRRASKVNKWIYTFMILGIFLPVNYLALIRIMRMFGIYGTRLGIILFYIAANIAFSTFIIYGFVDTVPREVDEAAIIDGANPVQLFFEVIFPLLKPVLVTAFILMFMGIWSDFMTPLYLINKTALWPMNLAVYNFFGRFKSDWNLVFADIVLTALPVLIVYLIGQKQIISGLTSGAVKG
ncbi:carbohydrate ABC transporter permease [Cellulosilyticum sp. I15G10I2]|uniref:carbohydrate ABC transporter permease n=1 Tax=Cellulosilyticum sp. I15G10I2 TaxID=1892843 RepID=UPI00085C8F60|nr:carbohydrate ABC transporter permease [Cellulosilyticum sp. I15G10I2]